MDENKAIKKNVGLLAFIQFLNQIDFYSVISILLFTEITGSFMLGMSVFSVTTLSTAIFELPTGILSDKIGRRKTITLGSIFSVASMLILLASTTSFGLIMYAIVRGIEKALFSGNNDAYLYDKLKESNKEKRFIDFIGKVNSMKYLAGAISALVGGIIVYFSSYKFVIFISVFPKIIQLVSTFFLDETIYQNKKNENIITSVVNPLKEVAKNKLLIQKICADSFMHAISESCYQFRSAFYEMVWPKWALGIPRILSNSGASISNWVGEKIIKRFRKTNIILFSVIYSIFSNIISVLMNNVISPIVMISNSLFQTDYIEAEIEQKLYKDEYRASMGSIKSLFESILFSVISVLLGLIADNFSVITAFVVFQLLRFIPLFILKRIMDKIEQKKKGL